MYNTRQREIISFDREIERTLNSIRREQRQALAMEGEQEIPHRRLLCKYVVPNVNGPKSSIVRPPVNAKNFEIKPSLIHMVQQE